MKPIQGLVFAFALSTVTFACMTWYSLFHMAGLYERLHNCERRQVTSPTQKEVAEYIESHNGSAPPASWYPNGDPWRNFTAKEASEMLADCEDTPENRKRWAEAKK